MRGAANNPYTATTPDKTLTQEGVAADAKAVGDALKGAELIVKHQFYRVNSDQYAQASLRVPDDCIAALYFVCADALVCPQSYENGKFTFRCFGNIRSQVLNALTNTTLSIELYYL